MSDSTAIDDGPIVFLDGVLVDKVSPLRTGHGTRGPGLFRIDYFGRGIAVAYADQIQIIHTAA